MEWRQRVPVLQPKNGSGIVQNIARIRGISSDKIMEFLMPTKKVLHNPKWLKNIEKASEIIIEAVLQGKKICLSADVDCDGVMSTAIMFRYLKQFTDNVYYIYHQRSDGHGIENQLHLIEDDTDLLIILDSSSNSVKACRTIEEKGIEIVILDHHQIDVENPHVTLVNPQNDDYPNKHLSGAGVAFKTIQVMDEKLKSGSVWDFIDLCAIGMFGDLMKVDNLENRYLIIQGMKNIRNYGVKAILDVKKIDEDNVNSQTLGFTIVPLINGCSRMSKIQLALQLVMSDDYDECIYLAEKLSKLNDQRKLIQQQLREECLPTIDFDDKILIAITEQDSKSFNGLVANNIAEEFQKPTLVVRNYKGALAGSYRTVGDFNVQSFLRKCPFVNSADGHTFAGGVTMYTKNLQDFKNYVNEELANHDFENVIEYDMEIDVDDITEDFLLDVEKINYLTGQGFPTVLFRVKGIVYDKDGRKTIGSNNNHVKIQLDEVTLVKFNTKSDYALDIPDMAEIEVVGQPNLNIYINKWGREYRTNQILLEDYKF